jgi:uncharacterized protein (TIGR03435 family)
MFRSDGSILLFLSAVTAFSQTQTMPLSFEVAVVQVNKSGETRLAVDMQGGGRFTMHNVPVKVMIQMAYKVRPEAVTGGPSWLDSDR